MQKPDNWVVLKLEHESGNITYKILAGWSGGYTQGSSWAMNSGIVKITDHITHWDFHGTSGSTYSCGKKSYGLRMNNAYVWDRLKEMHGDKVHMMDEHTDWQTIVWEEEHD
jgi:hypothetical protein